MQTFVGDEFASSREFHRNQKKNRNAENNENNNSQFDDDESQIEIKLQKQFRIVSVLLFALAIFLFVSMISYSPRDEVNTNISFSEFFRLIAGDGDVRAKFDGISNWLGIIGALSSDFMFNSTFGFITILIPLYLIFWSFEFFKSLELSRDLARRSMLYLIFGVLFASFLGTLQYMPMFSTLPKEFSGAIGQFVSTVFVGFLGSFGTILIIFAFAIITFIFGSKVNFNNLLLKLRLSERQPFKFIIEKKENLLESLQLSEDKPSEPKDESSGLSVISENEEAVISQTNNDITMKKREALPEDNTEPAAIIKRNLNLNNFNQRDNFATRIIQNSNNGSNPLQIMREPQNLDKQVEDVKPIIHNFINDNQIEETVIPEQELVEEFVQEEEVAIAVQTEQQNMAVSFNEENPRDILEKKRLELMNRLQSNYPTPVVPQRTIIPPIVSAIKPVQIQNNAGLHKEEVKPQITLTINDTRDIDDSIQPTTCLSTLIHDEDIVYIPPTRELLQATDDTADVNEEELAENARILQDKLMTFKIEIDNLSITPGPVVTQYEFVPAPGIKVSRIESLSDDIAMALKAKGIRIIAPIPGKGTVGIEIPNKKPSMVSFESIIRSSRFHQTDHKLPLALGKTIGGEVLVADLAKMPHLLIAGSTGSGKSVGINTVIASLLYKKHPSELKFVIIDPKKVELNQYSRLEKHFLASSPDIQDLIITASEDAVIVLKAVCAEMDKRYDILAGVGQRNILDYNRKVKAGKYKDDKSFAHRSMPYIVVIIDELADLMMTASKEVEAPIIRIAQLARAVGIHLVVATQRPSVDVITGIIKANFPARLAYLVASKIDSRTILDQSGAEQLLGNGDMLFLPGGSPKPIRIQNSFISTDEVEALCEHIADQEGYSQPYMLPSLIDKNQAKYGISKDDRDPLFEEAARMLIGLQQASVSIIQRRLKVGYARAGKIIDELEDAGVVGAYAGSKAREILMESESELEAIL